MPILHFGWLLSIQEFQVVQAKLEQANTEFVIAPQIRYEGQVGEQWTFFVFDLSSNPLEFKAFFKAEEAFFGIGSF
ncbi:MAG: hypothetical protein ACRBFS_18045 [Aureispira sp.]